MPPSPTEPPPGWDQELEDLLTEAVEAAERGDRAEVQRILDAHGNHAAAIQTHLRQLGMLGLMGGGGGDDRASHEPRPEQIGPYKILDVLGSGGMGVVYLAEQKEPVRRRVALKVIKLGMDSKQVLARFQAERQALAMMNHDCIAKVFDAGTTDRGQPFFAMEHVPGLPLTEHCDKHKLTIEARLLLFQKVCAAVQHAHHKGVIHRDLKPGNVLVTQAEGEAIPKIIDFGLARATDHRLLAATLYTEQGMVLGTPEYMSPEQAEMTSQDIDSRTDVYSLGVMLYELLVGALPFSAKELRAAGLHEIHRKIREDEPPKPSTRLREAGQATARTAERRRTSVVALLHRLRGDLDWIVGKAMEKDRSRRYETAAALADDLRRHLANEPVVARPPSAGYLLRKLGRRYRRQLVSAAFVLVALVSGLVGMWWFWREAELQASVATVQSAEAKRQEGIAREQARAAEAARAGEAAKAKEAAENAAAAHRNASEAERNAAMLAAKVREFDQLAGIVNLERLQTALEELAVPWKDLTAAQRWLGDADRVLALRAELEKTVADLRGRALPATPEELEHDRATHPRRADLQRLGAQLARLQQALQGGSPTLHNLTTEEEAISPDQLNRLAWPLVDPQDHAGKQIHAPRALALAAQAWTKIEAAGGKDCDVAATLAWAWFWNGKDDDAVRQSEAALALASEDRKQEFRGLLADLHQRIAAGEGRAAVLANADFMAREVARLRTEVLDLDAAVNERRTFRFASEAQDFLHGALNGLLAKLAAFAIAERAGVFTRLRCAELTTSHRRPRATWQQAAEAVANADGVVASALYKEHPISLSPQLGLVPIGMNPVTKLWEFCELRSAWDPARVPDPATLEIPAHDAEGNIEVGADTGIVFVLLPGGSFTMGAQSNDESGINYDPDAVDSEGPPRLVTLAPFFLARHELTQGQWRRLGGKGDQRLFKTGDTFPIADVDWSSSDALLRSFGLTLPTEAQWEYGCRARTTTPWWTGAHAESVANEFRDLRPIGSGRCNAFGLFDVHGNVWEWTVDWFGPYTLPTRNGDGLRQVLPGSSSSRVHRGGSFTPSVHYSRSSNRHYNAPTFRPNHHDLGLRAARTLQP